MFYEFEIDIDKLIQYIKNAPTGVMLTRRVG